MSSPERAVCNVVIVLLLIFAIAAGHLDCCADMGSTEEED